MSNWYHDLKKAQGKHPVGPATMSRASSRGVATAGVATIRVTERAPAQRVILLPPRGLVSPPVGGVATAATRSFLLELEGLRHGPGGAGTVSRHVAATAASRDRPAAAAREARVRMKVLDSVHEDGAKLAEMTAGEIESLRSVQPGLRVVPEVFYRPAVQVYFVEQRAKTAAATRASASASASKAVQLTLVDAVSGKPVANAFVVAFTDFANRVGAEGTTGSNGRVKLTFGAPAAKFERLYVYPELGYWPALKRSVKVSAAMRMRLTPIDVAFDDCVRHFYERGTPTQGTGVKVGVVDSGVALDHADLRVDGGECTITGEASNSYGALGGPHGSHVAGIIAARGAAAGGGVVGLAPDVNLYSYRVFNAGENASNFWIIKAIDRAVQAGCDLINLSLGGGPRDTAMDAAVSDARLAGSVCIAAAGNDGRDPVSQPAAGQLCVAVSAMGRKGTFPAGTTQAGEVTGPYGTDKRNFVAGFTNIGPEIDVAGPGVGVISTVPGGYGVMDGTSMACPAVTGVAARLLSDAANANVLNAARDESRANAIIQLLLQSSKKLGFGAQFEGVGLPRS